MIVKKQKGSEVSRKVVKKTEERNWKKHKDNIETFSKRDKSFSLQIGRHKSSIRERR